MLVVVRNVNASVKAPSVVVSLRANMMIAPLFFFRPRGHLVFSIGLSPNFAILARTLFSLSSV